MTELTWKDVLGQEKLKPYFQEILAFVDRERAGGKVIYPPRDQVFNAFRHTRFADIRVVIIGQDPYHEPGQAHGLSFSVPDGCPFPPSLANIFRELQTEYPGYTVPVSGNLERWAAQGVFLLNSFLTVEQGKPKSHENIGWEQFTDEVIRIIGSNLTDVVYMLWGSFAQRKSRLLDPGRNLLLKAAHPSPLSAYRGFMGCGHFVKANEYLSSHGRGTVDWRL